MIDALKYIETHRRNFDKLLKDAGFDDLSIWEKPIHEDTPPINGGMRDIKFLSHLPVDQQSEILFMFGIEYFERVKEHFLSYWPGRDDYIFQNSFYSLGVEDLEQFYDDCKDMPATVSIFCTNYVKEEKLFEKCIWQKPKHSPGLKVLGWLEKYNLTDKYTVFESLDSVVEYDMCHAVWIVDDFFLSRVPQHALPTS